LYFFLKTTTEKFKQVHIYNPSFSLIINLSISSFKNCSLHISKQVSFIQLRVLILLLAGVYVMYARWLDRGEDDGCIERELYPGEEEETEEPQLPATVEELPSDDLGWSSDYVQCVCKKCL